MRSFAAVFFGLLLLAGPAVAEHEVDLGPHGGYVEPTPGAPIWEPSRDILYDNGPFVTAIGMGAGGADISEVQTFLGMSTYGFGWQIITYGYRIADDFEIPAGETWAIERVTFFGYQTGSSTTSSYTGVYFQILDDMPPAGAIVFGDLVTNRMTGTMWTNCYRVLDTDIMATSRPIMCVQADINPPLVLGEGMYWVDAGASGSLSSGPWSPPVTILGVTTTGNALQYTTDWGPLMDSGAGAQQGFLFILEGTGGATPADDSTWGQVKALFR
jgi:hypothetical protein